MTRMLRATAAAFLLAGMAAACGDSPINPGPITPPPPPPPPQTNQAPVIESIAFASERAEVDTEIAVTAVVRDAETAVEQLRFEWRADTGTFSGEGAAVRWRPAKGSVATPADVTVRLTITEVYGVADANGVRPQHVVNGTSPAVRLHDSVQEVTDLASTFLADFTNSSMSPEATVRNFTDSCSGKQAELEDVRKNREHYRIIQSKRSISGVAFNAQRTRADVTAPCEFTSTVIKCHPEIPNCVVNMTTFAAGICAIEARYESRRWWLCDSRFLPLNGVMPFGFMR